MNIDRNISIPGENDRSILIDRFHPKTDLALPVVIFCHGFKGFKDWGAWDLMALAFAKAGYLFIKFNYSHNGGTAEQPSDFPDLEAFGNNNYSIEVRDTIRVLDWVEQQNDLADLSNVTLIGHSRAGGIATIVAQKNDRITKLITIAGVAHYKERFPQGKDLEQWKKEGVLYIKNGRTHQDMPLFFQFYEDFKQHEEDLNIIAAATKLNRPHLIIHGDGDPTVDVQDAFDLQKASKHSSIRIFRNADHVLGASHPWEKETLPIDLRQVVQCCLNFIGSTAT